jgi:hypothetical protein
LNSEGDLVDGQHAAAAFDDRDEFKKRIGQRDLLRPERNGAVSDQ